MINEQNENNKSPWIENFPSLWNSIRDQLIWYANRARTNQPLNDFVKGTIKFTEIELSIFSRFQKALEEKSLTAGAAYGVSGYAVNKVFSEVRGN